MRTILTMCIYNEEEFLWDTLQNTVKTVKDLDAIHILDGAWKYGGTSPNSSDKTDRIIETFAHACQSNYPELEIFFAHSSDIFESESAKRNHQLKLIDGIYGGEDYYAFVIDGDEEIRFPNGVVELWLRDYLKEQNNRCGLVTTYAYNQQKGGKILRFIPGNQGIHYHTGKSMCLHDKNCEMITDYTPGIEWINKQCFEVTDFFIMNKWNIRNKERQIEKDKFWQHQQATPEIKCTY